MGVLFLNLCITAFAYLFIPTIFCIRNKPLSHAKIRTIVIINGVFVWLLFTIIKSLLNSPGTSAAVFLWSFIADLIMTKRLASEEDTSEHPDETANPDLQLEEPQPEEGAPEILPAEPPQVAPPTPVMAEPTKSKPTEQAKILFCRKCGDKLIENGKFCKKCGIPITAPAKGDT